MVNRTSVRSRLFPGNEVTERWQWQSRKKAALEFIKEIDVIRFNGGRIQKEGGNIDPVGCWPEECILP